MGLWFAVFPTVETLVAQVVGSSAGDWLLLRRTATLVEEHQVETAVEARAPTWPRSTLR